MERFGLLTGLMLATMLLASFLSQAAFAFTFTKGHAYASCEFIKFQQCPKFNSYAHCLQWGVVHYSGGGTIKCCKLWYCGYID